MYKKIITILIVGIVMLTATMVFAGENYNSSRSNTATEVNKYIGDTLLRYDIGGAKINTVTDALAVGIDASALKAMLTEIGIGEIEINAIFAKLDELGTKLDEDALQVIAAPIAENIPRIGFTEISGLESEAGMDIFLDIDNPLEVSNPDAGCIEESETVIRKKPGRTTYSNITLKREVFQNVSDDIIQNIRSTVPEELKSLKEELKANRSTFKTEILSMSLSISENAKVLRENFRENVQASIGHVDHAKTARIAVAHGEGLKMLNRYRSAMARFEHILLRIESRVEKLEARNINMSLVIPIIEEAKNMQIENEAKMVGRKEKYEALLTGKNSQGIGEEAREIAKELKTDIQTLHAKLREIVITIKDNIAINEEGLQ